MAEQILDKEIDALNKICEGIDNLKGLSDGQKAKLSAIFGKRLVNALKAVDELAVKKYVFEPSGRLVWVVVGKERDYQVIPAANYCSCDDFYFHVIEGTTPICYHILAQKLAELLDRFEIIVDSDDIYDVLVGEWRFIKKEDFAIQKQQLKGI
ncbi:MAG: SWIM zinc finger family protein [Candidatus Bathyarchaeia archaeon]